MIDAIVSLKELQTQAENLAKIVSKACCILLWGDMGAGKTTFSKAFIRYLLKDINAEIPSPTFTLVQTYNADQGEIWHSDLYRLKNPEEILELGLLEALRTSICLIEWPDRLQNYLPNHRIDVYLNIVDEYHRSLRIEKKT
ncbi:MAG: tRNA (adenosine(37)-N6)-threonylcarbamoyltransferase complex ATPase subunit type 1 TsaE [Alphaproteobacteria bacterium]|nr:tRNA (adenosine(37)-N6)-threonylcarbamoyltransferase complex ATPase subunit type 1 TsaE [Alphaproteobacteria bacterium]